MRELGNNLDLIKEFGCDDVVLRQVLRQLIYFIVSISLNQLLGKCHQDDHSANDHPHRGSFATQLLENRVLN